MIAMALMVATVLVPAPPVRGESFGAQSDQRAVAYRKCIGAASLRMSRSPETAPVVAQASLTACSAERAAFSQSLMSDITKAQSDITEVRAAKAVGQFLARHDRLMRDYAAYVVTDARSGK